MMAYMYQTKNLYKQPNVLHLVALIIVFFERQRIKLSPLPPIRFFIRLSLPKESKPRLERCRYPDFRPEKSQEFALLCKDTSEKPASFRHVFNSCSV